MNSREWEVSRDVAVLPVAGGPVAYKGTTARAFRVSPDMGRWLARMEIGVVGAGVSPDEAAVLISAGLLEPKRERNRFSLNRLAPYGGAGWLTLVTLGASGALAWAVAFTHWQRVWERLQSGMTHGVAWATFLVTIGLLAFVHEWSHVAVLRALGGKAGRLILRPALPWVVVEVGPIHMLGPWQVGILAGAGILVETAVLGWALWILTRNTTPFVSGFAAGTTVQLLLDLAPVPWSDIRQITQLLVLAGRSRE